MKNELVTRSSTWSLSISLALITIAAVALAHNIYRKATKVRVACLVCVLGNLGSLTLHFVRFFKSRPSVGWYWALYFNLSNVYSSILCACLLGIGTRFYPSNNWNTLTFKVLCLCIIALDISVASIGVYLVLIDRDTIIRPMFITKSVLFIMVGSACLWYAFSPLLTLRKGRGGRNMKQESVAIGVWYLTMLGIISAAVIATHVVTIASGGPLNNLWYPIVSLDLLVRTAVAVVVAIPPPTRVIEWIKQKLFASKNMRFRIRERGVVSTGIVDTRNEWQSV